jgi:N-carbamoyl-L-amino-acid hydrolase
MKVAIALPRLRANIEALSAFGRNPGGQGITRSCWSPAHEKARAWLLARMRAAGLRTWVDAAGNTFGQLGGEGSLDPRRPTVMTGSHIDTVPQGGPLDGALGVLAGLECLEALRRAAVKPGRPLTLAAWSDEEGRYGGLFGSRCFTGRIDPKKIPEIRAIDGERLADAMAGAGFDARKAHTAKADPRSIAAYVELHIEQGPHLEEARVPIGVVEGIVGIRRNRLSFIGQADHAGATPMARRKDSFLAAADYALRARDHVVKRGSGRSVTNFGHVTIAPGVSNIVPGKTVLLQEMRELDARILARLDRECAALARAAAQRRGCRVKIEPVSRNESVRCAPRVMQAVERACAALRLRHRQMPSAAGHDAQNLARITDSGMLFIPSMGGRSHRPDEMSHWKDIERGANVLLHTLLDLAR